MKCEKCGSENVTVQLVNLQQLVDLKKKNGCLWWFFIGWWYVPIKWIVLTVILRWLILPFKMLLPKKQQLINSVESYKVCNNCGHHWQ